MKPSLHRILLFLLVLCSMGAIAQTPYTILLSGAVMPCDSNTVVVIQTVQGTQPQITMTVPVDANCNYSAVLNVSSAISWVQVSTSCNNGGGANNSGSATFNFLLDTANMVLNLNCTPYWDCLQIMNGPNLPGTACDDNDPNTINDLWDTQCSCYGTPTNPPCQAQFTVQQASNGGALIPWQITTTNTSAGSPPFIYDWDLPDGSHSSSFEPGFTFNGIGVYGICLTITDMTGCISWMCDTIVVDSGGYISTAAVTYDCLGVLWGPALPGTPCDDGNPVTTNDVWDINCGCNGTIVSPTCQAYFWVQQAFVNNQPVPWVMNTVNQSSGGAPVTYQWWLPDGSSSTSATPSFTFTQTGVYGICLTITADSGACTSTMCDTIYVDPNGLIANTLPNYDCLGIAGGLNLPGTPCDDGNPNTINDTWTASCACIGTSNNPCNATFVVAQVFDSLQMPIPNSLWVIPNFTVFGGMTYLWDFGDGTTSTATYPTHTYANAGPYLLCLTVSGLGCTATFCDTIAVDPSGIIIPGQPGSGQGFTINVTNGTIVTNLNNEILAAQDLRLYPNPVQETLNIEFSSIRNGQVHINIIDLAGRSVSDEFARTIGGTNKLAIDTRYLDSGTYLLHITADGKTTSRLFVKSK